VIGGTSGTGMLVARSLARRGCAVRVLARHPNAPLDNVQHIVGDVTRPETLAPAVAGIDDLVYTAGIRAFFAPRADFAVAVTGVEAACAAAKAVGMQGRFVFLSSIGVGRASPFGVAVDVLRGKGLAHKREGEVRVRESGLDYTIVRAGVLTDGAANRHAVHMTRHAVHMTRSELPLHPWLRIARADVAEVIANALDDPSARNTTLEVAWRHS
jgi:uncharacterized protein YbjT (DUF2867 family)